MFTKKILTPVFSVIFMGAIALSASGCGKSLSKLTDEQKAALGDTLQGAGRGAIATRNVGGQRRAGAMAALPANAQWIMGLATSSSSSSSTSRDENEAKLEAKLQAAYDNKTCDVTADMPKQSYDGSVELNNLHMSLKASGNNCPFAMDFAISVQGSKNNVSGQVACKYTVTDAELAKLVDVSSLAMDGSFSVSASSDSMKVSMDIKGSLSSLKHGNVTFSASASGSATRTGSGDAEGSVEVVTDFVFPNFEAELKVKMDGKKKTYLINGEEVTESEFMTYFNKTGVSSMGGASMGGSTTTTPSNPYPTFPPTGANTAKP